MNKLNYRGIEIQVESDTLFLVALQNILDTMHPIAQMTKVDSDSILENIKRRVREKNEGKT